MTRKTIALTDRTIRTAKFNPAGKGNKLFDGAGRHIAVLPTGTKSWRWKYRYNGVERLMVLGTYPQLGLADTRAARVLHAKVLGEGRDPQAAKAVATTTAPGGQTFEAVARDRYGKRTAAWQNGDFARDLMARFKTRVFPKIGKTNIAAVTPLDCLSLCRAIENEGKVRTARKLFRSLREVFNYAMAAHHITFNPAAAIQAALAEAEPHIGRRAVVEIEELCELLRSTEAVNCQPIFKLALRFLALTAARASMVLGATWDEIKGLDGNSPTWVVPATRMKMALPWSTPLCGAALDILRAVKPFGTGRYIFPDWHGGKAVKPLAAGVFNHLLERAGWLDRHTAHTSGRASRLLWAGARTSL